MTDDRSSDQPAGSSPTPGAPETAPPLRQPRRRTVRARVAAVVGAAALLVAADYGLGLAVDTFRSEEPPPAVGPERGTDPRTAAPAMAGDAWAAAHFAALDEMTTEYWPLVEAKPEPYSGGSITVTGWDRRSATPGAGGDGPSVWFLGGSLAFGVGQRDEHTIASEVARLAAADGLPVQVRNVGRPGWVHFQEAILYEQLLAEGPAPELAVFLDGATDIRAHAAFDEPVPALLDTQEYAVALGGRRIQTGPSAPPEPDLTAELWRTYRDHSFVAGLLGSDPADAQDVPEPSAQGDPEPDDALASAQTGREAVEIYARGQVLTRALSEQYGVDARWYWQPLGVDRPAGAAARGALDGRATDLTSVLAGHKDVFIDAVDVNEEGAHLLAVAIWEDLRPAVEAWHRDHGG